VAVLDGKMYCIGGCIGQVSIVDCEVYDPVTDQWAPIAPLGTGMYQLCCMCIVYDMLVTNLEIKEL
jgi:hypothetical protein